MMDPKAAAQEIRLSLTEEDWAALMLMVGYACGAADRALNTDISAIFKTLCKRMREQQENATPETPYAPR